MYIFVQHKKFEYEIFVLYVCDSKSIYIYIYIYTYSDFKFCSSYPIKKCSKIKLRFPVDQDYNIVTELELDPVSLSVFFLKSFIYQSDSGYKLLFMTENDALIENTHELLVFLSKGIEDFELVSMSYSSRIRGLIQYKALKTATVIMVNVKKFIRFIEKAAAENKYDSLMKLTGAKCFNVIILDNGWNIVDRKQLLDNLFDVWSAENFSGHLVCLSHAKENEKQVKHLVKEKWMKRF